MVKVVFWQANDTVVNPDNPNEIFEILTAEIRPSGVWVVLKNYHTGGHRAGFEEGFQDLGFIGYRKDKNFF